LRSIHALLTGDLLQAAAYNPLTALFYPLLVAVLLVRWLRQGNASCRPLPIWLPWAIVVVIVLFGVLRNIPVPPFDQLAPHRLL